MSEETQDAGENIPTSGGDHAEVVLSGDKMTVQKTVGGERLPPETKTKGTELNFTGEDDDLEDDDRVRVG